MFSLFFFMLSSLLVLKVRFSVLNTECILNEHFQLLSACCNWLCLPTYQTDIAKVFYQYALLSLCLVDWRFSKLVYNCFNRLNWKRLEAYVSISNVIKPKHHETCNSDICFWAAAVNVQTQTRNLFKVVSVEATDCYYLQKGWMMI